MPDERYARRELSCLMFENYQGKKANPKAPDLTGELLINGQAYSAAMWRKQSQRGGEYFSLNLKPKTQTQGPPAAQSPARNHPPRGRGPVNGPDNEPTLPLGASEPPPEEPSDVPF